MKVVLAEERVFYCVEPKYPSGTGDGLRMLAKAVYVEVVQGATAHTALHSVLGRTISYLIAPV